MKTGGNSSTQRFESAFKKKYGGQLESSQDQFEKEALKELQKRAPSKTSEKDLWEFLNDEAKVFPLTERLYSITGIPPALTVAVALTWVTV